MFVGAALGMMAFLLVFLGYRSPFYSSWRSPWAEPVDALVRQPVARGLPAEDGVSERRGTVAAAATNPLGKGAAVDPLALVIAAQSDVTASDDLVAYIKICDHVRSQFIPREQGGRGKRDDRFRDPAWAMLAARCDKRTAEQLLAGLGNSTARDSDQWLAIERFMDLAEDPSAVEHLEERDRFAQAILETSKEPELVAAAAELYFDRARLREWAAYNLPDSLLQDKPSRFDSDLATMIACRVGMDCSPFALRTIAQCLEITSCRPGMSLEQVIRMRRSPQEMELIKEFAGRILQRRPPGG